MGRRRRNAETEPQAATEPASQQHNAGVRTELLRKAKRKIDGLSAEIAQLNEQKSALSKERGDVYRDLKNDLGMNRIDVELVLRIVALEGDEQAQALDTIREAWAALSEGDQGDLFPTREDAPAEDGSSGGFDDAPIERATQQGRKAGLSGKSAKLNPYALGTGARGAWDKAWNAAQEEIAFGKNGRGAKDEQAAPAN